MSAKRVAVGVLALALVCAEVVHPTHFAAKRLTHSIASVMGGSGMDANVLDGLPPIDKLALGSIDFVQYERNGTATAITSKTIVPADSQIVLLGWCGDPDTRGSGGGAFLAIDGRQRIDVSRYLGGSRPDVVRVLSSEKLANSGFRIVLPPAALGPGTHELQFAVIAADRRGYFTLGGPIDVTVADSPTH